MKILKISLILVLSLSIQVQAQSLVEVLEAHAAVMGFENLKNVKSTVIKGQNHMGDHGAAPFASYTIKPDMSRTETEIRGQKMIVVRNGDNGWMTDFRNGGIIETGQGQRGQGQRPQGRRGGERPDRNEPGAKPENKEEGREGRAQAGRGGGQRGGGMAGMRGGMRNRLGGTARLGGVLFDWQTKKLDVALGAAEVFEGTNVFVVKSVDTLNNVTLSYIDQDSFVLLKETSVRTFGQNEIKSSRIFSNYEMVDDIAVAFNVENKREGGGQAQGGRGGRGFGGGSSNQVIESIEFNIDIDPALFEKPVN